LSFPIGGDHIFQMPNVSRFTQRRQAAVTFAGWHLRALTAVLRLVRAPVILPIPFSSSRPRLSERRGDCDRNIACRSRALERQAVQPRLLRRRLLANHRELFKREPFQWHDFGDHRSPEVKGHTFESSLARDHIRLTTIRTMTLTHLPHYRTALSDSPSTGSQIGLSDRHSPSLG
jgi:hypothetical protein